MAHTSEEEKLEGHNVGEVVVEEKLDKISRKNYHKPYGRLNRDEQSEVWELYWSRKHL